ncbi:MAG: hypothetical protein IJT30_06650 [Muribaculaceae bacterium]|nr:hypothetical protein [Muribaculaceae bacterium]
MALSHGKISRDRPDYIKWALPCGALIAIALFAFFTYRHFRPDVNVDRFEVRGIDVSRHNGNIDWHKVADSGIRFVFIKATEGASFRNPILNDQCLGAREAGLKVGFYHFFRKNRDGVAQARHFLATVEALHPDLPLAIDIENSHNDNDVDDTTVVAQLMAMVAVLEQQGFSVMIYTNGDGYNAYYHGHLDQNELWLSSFREPDSIAHLGHRIQQYSHWGTVDGVSTDVDLNVFMGSERDWEKWLKQQKH